MKIAMLPSIVCDASIPAVTEVCRYLKSKDVEVITLEKYCGYGDVCSYTDDFYGMIKNCDIVAAIGGDGIMLHAAKHAAQFDKPVLCINCGRMGYLASMEAGEITLLDKVADGNYRVLERRMLSVSHESKDEIKEFYALNDAVLGSGNIAKTVEIEVMCENRTVMKVKGDGVIFSTPTGSTAYAFSAGGPVIDPNINCVSLTPVCPHSFSTRTLVFSAPVEFTAKVHRGEVFLTVDGEEGIRFESNDTLHIGTSDKTVKFITLKDKSFFDVFREKINE
ncbi:MAG TPA: NAD(+)/NADH kinase [Oscillospiraceae bacterium]|nr:NAD(+)/NADH kinase [Oscillospiraceae bacterium]HPF55640.1 NAD(+)/NADH kinase [Clostridiales bacterium]HPK34207.1 NAD(+)/NADH kinase [Oscillospiraceae bacterium]HPR74890.1 NAD(+)/NADH kinase [Oscillospiraceae bacterium]